MALSDGTKSVVARGKKAKQETNKLHMVRCFLLYKIFVLL